MVNEYLELAFDCIKKKCNYAVLSIYEHGNRNNIRAFITIYLLIFSFVCVYALNKHTTLIVDDFVYSYNWASGERITTLKEIIESQYNHYFTWGGRSIVHSIASFFLIYDKMFFNVANSIAYLLLVVVIYFHGVGRFVIYPTVIILINFVFYSFMPVFGQSFLWLTGASNYLWGPLIALSYLLLYRFQYGKQISIIKCSILLPIVFIVGIIAGWTNENISLALLTMIFLFLLFSWINKETIYLWQVVGFLGVLIGTLFLILAPGNFVRAANSGDFSYIGNFFRTTKFMIKPDVFLYPLIISVIVYMFSNLKNKKDVLLVYIVGFIIATYSLVGAPSFAERALSGSTYIITIIMCYIYSNLELKYGKLWKVSLLCFIVMHISSVNDFRNALNDVKKYELRHNQNLIYAMQEMKKGNKDIVINPNYSQTRFCAAWELSDISKNPNDWTAKSFARYYGFPSVRTRAD